MYRSLGGSPTSVSGRRSSTSAARSSARGGPIGDRDDDARFPTLYFRGCSGGAQHQHQHAQGDATIRGKVSTLSDGAVRWQFVREVGARRGP